MVSVGYKKMGLKIQHLWFHKPSQHDKSINADILYYHGIKEDDLATEKAGRVTKQCSWITDLSQELDEIYHGIKKNYKYEIRRVEKEDVSFGSFSSQDKIENSGILDIFEKTYNKMYQDKGMKNHFNRKLVERYISDGSIYFSIATFEKEPLVFHSYIVDNENARFFYSTSPFREKKDLANEISRMNKALHWQDICFFKNSGVTTYDWGGIMDPENPSGIDNFKMGFPGKLIHYNNEMIGNSLLGKFVIKCLH